MSKPATSGGWVRAFCISPVFAIIIVIAGGAIFFAPANQPHAASPSPSMSAPVWTPAARARIQAGYGALPLGFEQNQGQTEAQVKYISRASGYTLFLTGNEAVFSLHSRPRDAKEAAAALRMQMVGGDAHARVSPSEELEGKSNYFIGNDRSKWRTDVARYGRVSYENVYPGVNLAFHGAQRQLEFDFLVAPGANAAPIAFKFSGNQGLTTDGAGNLIVDSAAGAVLLHKPVAYQEQNGARQLVEAQFVLQAENRVGLELGNYDHSRALVIDPTVSYAYSTYLGGLGVDTGQAISFDGTGNAYVTGQTASANFPMLGGVGAFGGASDAFVTKIKPDGSGLVYSTYIGGAGVDSGNAIAVDGSGNAFIAGGTASTNFPTTSGAFQKLLVSGAAENAFVLELNSAGNALIYSTLLGGSGNDVAIGMAVDNAGNAYVGGSTTSTTFPKQNPIQSSMSGTPNGFVTKLNSSGSALMYSTYLGAAGGDIVNAVAVDSSGDAYVTGRTSGSSFPTTAGAFQTKCGSDGTCNGGLPDAFVSVINPGGTGFVYSTFLGGSGIDIGDGIAVDATGNAYVTGETASTTTFPLKSSPATTYGGGAFDAFVTKLNATGTGLVYSIFLGGSSTDTGTAVAVDGFGVAYVTGQTSSSNFPTKNPTQSSAGGAADGFVSEINGAGSLAFSTYLGGSGDENLVGNFGVIGVDTAGASIYVTGSTTSTNFPTHSALKNSNGGLTDAFVVKYIQTTFDLAATTPAAVSAGNSGTSTVTLTAVNGYNSSVNLSCSVSGGGSPAPACSASSFSPGSVTPTAGGATSTLTITTTPAGQAQNVSSRKILYAAWLPVLGLSFVGMSFSTTRSRRKRLLGFLMILMVMAALFLMPACGGSSSSGGGGGGGGGGTPAGAYTVTITGTGTDANATTQATQVTLTVN